MNTVRECLTAAADGPFFLTESHTLFDLEREEVRLVAQQWPEAEDREVQRVAVANSLNHMLWYPHRREDAWHSFISAKRADVAGLAKCRSRDASKRGESSMKIQWLANRGNLQLAQMEVRLFPGLLVQGDTLSTLIADLEEEAPGSFALATAQGWLRAYEEMMAEQGLDLPYHR